MVHIEFVNHLGKRILLEDFSNAAPGHEFAKDLKKGNRAVAGEPLKSVRLLLDFSNSTFNESSIGLIKEFAQNNTPYILETTLVGVVGLMQLATAEVSKASGREYMIFNTRAEALDYLASIG